MSSGINGSAVKPSESIEVDTRVARYRTAVVTLLDMIRRNRSEYMSWPDQLLVAQVQRMLDEDALADRARIVEPDL